MRFLSRKISIMIIIIISFVLNLYFTSTTLVLVPLDDHLNTDMLGKENLKEKRIQTSAIEDKDVFDVEFDELETYNVKCELKANEPIPNDCLEDLGGGE